MADISVWKRVGGWLRRSQSAPGGSEATPLDAEGLLISPSLEEVHAPEPERTAALVRPSKKEDQLTAMEEGFGRLVDVLEAIRRRRSVRAYSSQPIRREVIDRMRQALRSAPSACNYQPWHFVIVSDEELRREIARALLEQNVELGELAKKLSPSGRTVSPGEDAPEYGRLLEEYLEPFGCG